MVLPLVGEYVAAFFETLQVLLGGSFFLENGLCMSSKGFKSTELSINHLAKSLIWVLPYYFF